MENVGSETKRMGRGGKKKDKDEGKKLIKKGHGACEK